MAASNNNGGFSRMGTDPTVSGLRDGTDFPHSGIYHALNSATQGNYAIIDGNNFNITQTDVASNSRFVVAAGRVFRDGALVAEIATATFNQGTPSTFDEPTSGNAYFLLVVNSSNALAILGDKATTDLVPNLTNRDEIPIAVIRLTSGENYDARHIQFLTTSKDENSLSIGHNDSGYTESGTITGDSNSIDVTATVSNGHVNLKPNGSGRVNIISTDGNDAELVISKDVAGGIGRTGISLISPNSVNDQSGRITLERTAASSFIGMDIASDSQHGMRFLTGDGSETERMRITSAGNVGIGTSSPTEMLHLSDADASEPTILIENTGTSTTEPNLTFSRTGSHPSDPTVDIGRIGFQGDNDANQDTLYAAITGDAHVATDSDERGRMRFHVMRAGAITEVLRLGGYEVCVNESSNDVDFRVEGNTVTNLLKVNAGADTVGIGSDAPDHTLTVNGTIARKGLVRNVTTVIGASGPPTPLPVYSVLDTDDLIIASAPSGGVPPNSLDVQLPDAAAEDIGRTYRIVAIDVAAGLTINRTGSDDVFVDEAFAGISLPFSLSVGKVYDITCVDTNKWMVMTLN